MLLHRQHDDRLAALADQVRDATTLDSELLSTIIQNACTRLHALNRHGSTAALHRLIDAGAWTDVALALVALELPGWTVRRLVREDGKWLCSLSRQPNLPVALDDSADASHAVLPLAILGAFLEARRRATATGGVASRSSQSVPRVQPTTGYAVCCDSFA
jgi:hypothetical protein